MGGKKKSTQKAVAMSPTTPTSEEPALKEWTIVSADECTYEFVTYADCAARYKQT